MRTATTVITFLNLALVFVAIGLLWRAGSRIKRANEKLREDLTLRRMEHQFEDPNLPTIVRGNPHDPSTWETLSEGVNGVLIIPPELFDSD